MGELDGLTDAERRLGDEVTVAEWRAKYQPAGVGFRHYPLPQKIRTPEAAGPGPWGMAGAGETPCPEPVGEAAVWEKIGKWMTGEIE